jgi:hypothetical protein
LECGPNDLGEATCERPSRTPLFTHEWEIEIGGQLAKGDRAQNWRIVNKMRTAHLGKAALLKVSGHVSAKLGKPGRAGIKPLTICLLYQFSEQALRPPDSLPYLR